MKIVKVRNVKTPTRGTGLSAGLDFYIPEDFEAKQIWPGESINIPSGIRARIPRGCALIMFNKSGIATKYQLQVGACVVDEDYQGEIHLHVMNVGKDPVILKPGMKLVQGLVMPVLYVGVEVLESEDELFSQSTERGIATKYQLQVGACVVDEDYQGEIHLHVMNVGKDPVILKPGMKLVQGLVMPVLYVGVEVLESEDELFSQSTERGVGGFGSTGE